MLVWRLGPKQKHQNRSVLNCVTQCSQSAAHLYEQFLQVQQIWFVTLGGTVPLRCAWRWLPRVVLLYHGGVVLAELKPDLDDQLVSFSALTLLVSSSGL